MSCTVIGQCTHTGRGRVGGDGPGYRSDGEKEPGIVDPDKPVYRDKDGRFAAAANL